ncbi:VapE domain-containing protein [Bilifractor sp. LCP19S3_H10]|uniref:VapE domain-containing protein n=1 Tax=Bilifractor sp. LCP19S3_H10 TaxID=3438736 RepID=UPI003F93C8DD
MEAVMEPTVGTTSDTGRDSPDPKDLMLKISVGNSRKAGTWNPMEISFGDLCEKLQEPIRTAEMVAEYQKMSRAERDEAKDKGGFVAGIFKGKRRKKEEVLYRTAITLDEDKLELGFLDWYREHHQYASVFYTTHSHTPEKPRGRIVIPTTRPMTPDETNAIARYLAAEFGMSQVDVCSFEINQLMFWPTCPSDGEYICEVFDGDVLNPDTFLAAHPEWWDVTTLPVSPDEKREFARQQKKQEDPLTKNGLVGNFCRAHSITDVMEHILQNIYEPGDRDDRWHYIGASSSAGVVVYDDKFAYSHHASDPACGQLLNSFDLVRVHLFGDDDPKKSLQKMTEFAANDEATQEEAMRWRKQEAVGDFSEEEEGTSDSGSGDSGGAGSSGSSGSAKSPNGDTKWMKKLQRNKRTGELLGNLHNLLLIMKNDPYMKNIVFNQLADGMEIAGDVPWKHPGRYWRDADDAQLICYIDEHYGTFSQRNFDLAVTKAADDRSYHPIRDYFQKLPEWDGIPRVETLLVDYLGAEDNAYVHAVTKKELCAALRRIKDPGAKFDNMIVLNGPQGIGKSTLISKLGMEWFSDSLSMSDMNDKTAAEKLQGYWIHEIGELAGMRKADLDKVKSFVSRRDDKYRASFGRRVEPHPRQCVFFGTTNAEKGYLRDITGNRRYWNVKVTGQGKYHPWDLNQETIDQIWAEVKVLEPDEKLYLSADLEGYAEGEQKEAMEQDDREGMVREYLDTLLPENWEEMAIDERRNYFLYGDDPLRAQGKVQRQVVSNIEIWCECFGKKQADIEPKDSYAIAAIMERMENWEKTGERRADHAYGRQRVYIRKTDEE